MKIGETVRDGIRAAVLPMFGTKMSDWWYDGCADTKDLAILYRDLG